MNRAADSDVTMATGGRSARAGISIVIRTD